jgi:hypothetical protein
MATIEARPKKIQKYFKYRKIEYIRRFYRNKNTLISLKISENEDVLVNKKS